MAAQDEVKAFDRGVREACTALSIAFANAVADSGQAVRLVIQKENFSRSADANLPASESTHRIATLAWLARAGALRGWSLGTSWAQESGQAAKRELFVKYQQGWNWH